MILRNKAPDFIEVLHNGEFVISKLLVTGASTVQVEISNSGERKWVDKSETREMNTKEKELARIDVIPLILVLFLFNFQFSW